MGPRSQKGSSLLQTAAPFMIFMVAGWFGIMTLQQSKRDIRAVTRGLDAVEESDPLERMRAAYGIGATHEKKPAVRVSTIQEELENVKKKIDLSDFEYVPVPRTEGWEELGDVGREQ
ncbi:hypothetical protein FOA52_011675 [Chlamydomonas sp. UWO 241]|nr:hypothetical protein FOA52_011675 [Chlamydomonas sp. UWO 241]